MKRIIYLVLCIILSCKVRAQESNWTKTYENGVLRALETTNWGLSAGEYDTRAWLNPYNGVLLSNDLGESWNHMGLPGRGVTNLRFFEGALYATTYYVGEGSVGLFKTSDMGETWIHLGPSVSASSISLDEKTIYLGTFSNGLWISKDGGATWVQKIGTGWFGPKIQSIKSSEDVTIVSTVTKVYKTIDKGESWEEVPDLSDKTISDFIISDTYLLAGTLDQDGLYESVDMGVSWNKISSFGNTEVSGLLYKDKKIYAGKPSVETGIYSVYESEDFGETWVESGIPIVDSASKITGISWFYSEPFYIFVSATNEGVFRKIGEETNYQSDPIFSIPWWQEPKENFVEKISAFFDHSYPLLNYKLHQEPYTQNQTTLNFWGSKGYEPYLYYSSHDGVDFVLDYGEPVLAVESGYASYHFCDGCGHAIKIVHQNGYETYYKHLQGWGLVSTSGPVWVNTGDQIGLIGMTGVTTGPHLHFSVVKSDLGDPDGRVDPFGWRTNELSDPWEEYSWSDESGNHRGTKSIYLWKEQILSEAKFIGGGDLDVLNLDNKTISLDKPINVPLTAKAQVGPKPIISKSKMKLKHVGNTSLFLDFYNPRGKKILELDTKVKLKFNLDDKDLKNIKKFSLKTYLWDKISKLWKPLPSVFDETTNTLESETDHLSHFAVFGEKIDEYAPETQLVITVEESLGWYTNPPLVSFVVSDIDGSEIENTFYSLDDGFSWETYSQPFIIYKEGVTNLLFRSQDISKNLEETKNTVVKVDTLGKWKDKVIVKNNSFVTAQ